MARGEYLLEVRSEEIPARMLAAGVRELATRVFEELMARDLRASEIETGFTPRRLLVRMSGLQEREPDREEQVMGPPVRAAYAGDGSPTPALLGFARRCGVEPEQLEPRLPEREPLHRPAGDVEIADPFEAEQAAVEGDHRVEVADDNADLDPSDPFGVLLAHRRAPSGSNVSGGRAGGRIRRAARPRCWPVP